MPAILMQPRRAAGPRSPRSRPSAGREVQARLARLDRAHAALPVVKWMPEPGDYTPSTWRSRGARQPAWNDWEPGHRRRGAVGIARWSQRAGRADPVPRVRPVPLRRASGGASGSVAATEPGADRRPADLRRAGQRRRLGAARPVPARRDAAGRRSWRACRPTTSAQTASSGATRSTAGRRTRRRSSPGGSPG